MTQNKIAGPELLVPAGSVEKMEYAFAYGADAVYAGIPQFSLRARENAITESDLALAIKRAHALNKKFYLTVNILAHNRKIKPFVNKLESMMALNPDALIMADLGLVDIVRERYPKMPIHISVQTNTMNWAAVRLWQKLGVARIILSREVSIQEIQEIKQQVPDMEIEAFVHGAVCVAHSGRCLLSNYFSYRDANDGCCTNACRWEYQMYEHVKEHYIEEKKRPGEFMKIEEDEHGTYILNARDLRAVEHVGTLAKTGVDSLKIEGRNKSVFYVAIATKAYRKAINDYINGKPFDVSLIEDLNKIHNRGYTAGFLIDRADKESQRYEEGLTNLYTQEFSAVVNECQKGKINISPRNKLCVGDKIEIITPTNSYQTTVKSFVNEEGAGVDSIHGGTSVNVWMPFEKADPEIISPYTLISKIRE